MRSNVIPLSIPEISGNEWKYIKECLDTNWVSSVGSYVTLFEDRFKEYVKAESAIVTMNGTSALTLALQTLGIGQEDEVIVPSMTFVATVNPIFYVGAKPVFADISRENWVLDVESVKRSITEKTKAIIPVHLYGNMVEMEKLMIIAEKHKIQVIEDATESLGSFYEKENGEWISSGTIGHIGVFSFNGNKLITTGAGGMLVTNDKELGKKAKYLSNQAKTTLENGGFIHNDIGYNYRMPNVIAAMGVAQLENIELKISEKKKIAKYYDELLKCGDNIELLPKNDKVQNCRWLYSIIVKDAHKRDSLIKYLKENEIESRPFFAEIHKMKPYEKCKSSDMENTEYISARGINLPCSVGIKEDEIRRVCEKVNDFFESR